MFFLKEAEESKALVLAADAVKAAAARRRNANIKATGVVCSILAALGAVGYAYCM